VILLAERLADAQAKNPLMIRGKKISCHRPLQFVLRIRQSKNHSQMGPMILSCEE